MIPSKLVKEPIKFSGITDWGVCLSEIWASDSSRGWDTYSKETFRQFWDDRNTVDMDVKVKGPRQ